MIVRPVRARGAPSPGRFRRGCTRVVLLLGVLVGVVGTGAQPAAADEAQPSSVSAPVDYRITMAARVCDGFEQISAARVRGDRAESPRQPGRDSPYAPGQAVDAQVEAAAQPGCRPLPGVAFTLGSGRSRGAPLSVVTGAFRGAVSTRERTPLLDARGLATGGTLAGATTVTLTGAQRAAAQSRTRLWVQGGTPQVPLPGGGQLAFGTLRCALDQRDGANVAWVAFPAQVRHVLCVAYYVAGSVAVPVGTGTVVVQVALTRPVGYPQPLRLRTDLSYAPDGIARLAVPGGAETLPSLGSGSAVRFTRLATAPGGLPYSVVAEPPPGWTVASLTCTSTSQTPSGVGTSGAGATIVLAAGDTVTCAYLFGPPPVAGLVLRTVSEGGTGTFGYAVRGPVTADLGATTGVADEPVYAAGADLSLLPVGSYPVTQTVTGPWRLKSVTCDGQPVPVSGSTATIDVPTPGAARDCVFHNVREPGNLTLRLATAGGAGGGLFAVAGGSARLTPVGGFGLVAGTPDGGTPISASGDLPTSLPLGEYDITAVPALATVTGSWRLTALACDDGPGSPPIGADGPASVTVTLTADKPARTCTASYTRVASTRLRVIWAGAPAPPAAAPASSVEVVCADQATGRLVVGPAGGDVELPRPLYFAAATSCDVTAGAGVPAGLSVTVRTVARETGDAPAAPPVEAAMTGLPAHVVVDPTMTEIVVTLRETAPAPSASAPAPVVAGGSFPVPPMALVGAGVVLAGAFLLLLVLVRARTQRR